jgi:CRP-like cAMP-binding protein
MTIDRTATDSKSNPVPTARAGNLLLRLMTSEDRDRVMRSATREQLSRGAILTDADQVAGAIYFIEHGVASVIALGPDAEKTEIALIGPESFVGAPVVIGDGRWPYRTFVQVDQLSVIRWPIDDARAALDSSRSLERLLTHAAYTQMVQVAEGLISMAWQRLDARLARWLLMYRDRLRSDRLDVTHEFMALMVGVQRTGVTEALHDLEGQGLISATRGVVMIRNPQGLRRLAGHGYGVTEREHDRLFLRQPVLPSDEG